MSLNLFLKKLYFPLLKSKSIKTNLHATQCQHFLAYIESFPENLQVLFENSRFVGPR